MSRLAVGAVAVLLLAGCAPSSSVGSAVCAPPRVTVTPSTFAAGDDVRVRGQWFFDDCYDTGQTGTPPATRGLEIRLVTSRDAARTFVLATVDADRDGSVDTAVRIPDDVPPGAATVAAGFSERADVVVTAP